MKRYVGANSVPVLCLSEGAPPEVLFDAGGKHSAYPVHPPEHIPSVPNSCPDVALSLRTP